MSKEEPITHELSRAKATAEEVVKILSPHCERIEIAGSIRRGKGFVKDIEIVAIPKPYETGLFESGIAAVVNQWEKVKGTLDYERCRYTQRILPNGIKLDLFFANKENWGLILAIRTGSAEYSYKVLATTWVKFGYRSEAGKLMQGNRVIPIPEETDLFELLKIPYTEPKNRNL
jgi:DNA polymerase/3'-5' exonuclease PolX